MDNNTVFTMLLTKPITTDEPPAEVRAKKRLNAAFDTARTASEASIHRSLEQICIWLENAIDEIADLEEQAETLKEENANLREQSRKDQTTITTLGFSNAQKTTENNRFRESCREKEDIMDSLRHQIRELDKKVEKLEDHEYHVRLALKNYYCSKKLKSHLQTAITAISKIME